MSLPKICTCPTVPAADCPFHHQDACGSLAAMPCSAERGYETFIKGKELTMKFQTNADAVAFFDWIMENTHHKKQNDQRQATASTKL
jgi:hypothetical protein